MNIGIFPCQGRCNVSMMTKTVAEFFVDDEAVRVLSGVGSLSIGDSGTEERYIAINGCPAKCASKEFTTANLKPHEEIVITKDFDPKNNAKYEVLLSIDEEVGMVQEVIDRLLASK